MIVSYDGGLMRSIALEQAVAAEQLGDAAAAWLHALLAEIEATETAGDLFSLFGNAISVEGDKGAFDASGAPAWLGVRRLKLIGVEANDHSG